MNIGLYTSNSNEWATPQELFDDLNREFNFTLDPCCTYENAKCEKYYTQDHDGLSIPWGGEVVYMNPPYGKSIINWMRKAFIASLNGATVVCLVPARTDTKWWHCYAIQGEIRFIRGRLKFSNSKNSAPFPSAIVIFRPQID